MVSVMLYPCMFALLMAPFVLWDSVCELFAEKILNMFGCGCYFVVECYEVVYWRLLDHVWSSKESVCVVHTIPEVV